MLARIRKAKEQEGFTLIELLVVMIIIGILAAIAIPVFLSQRAKAQDSAAKADVSTVGKEVATYYVDATIAPAVTIAGGRYVLNAAAGTAPDTTPAVVNKDLGKASTNVVMGASFFTDSTAWCVSVNNPKGDKKLYKYSAAGGLGEGACASAAG